MALRLWLLLCGWILLASPIARGADGQGAWPDEGPVVTITPSPGGLQAPQLREAYERLDRARTVTRTGVAMYLGGGALCTTGILVALWGGLALEDRSTVGLGVAAFLVGALSSAASIPTMIVGGHQSARALSQVGIGVSRTPLYIMWAGAAVILAGAFAPGTLPLLIPAGSLMLGGGAVAQGFVSSATLRRRSVGGAVALVPSPLIHPAARSEASMGGGLTLIVRL